MTIKQLLKVTVITGLFALLLVPFIVTNGMYFPYIVGKAFTLRIIIEIVFALWLILIFKDKESRLKFSWVALIAFLFVSVMFLADIFGVAPAKSLWSNFERMDGWVTLIHLLMYFVVFASVIKNDFLSWFLRTSVFLSFIMSIMSFVDITNGIYRVSGPLGNPIYLSVYFLFNFFFILVLLYRDVLVKCLTEQGIVLKKLFSNWLFYIYLCLGGMFTYLVYNTSRGVILGLGVGLLISALLITIFEKKNVFVRKTSVVIFAVMFIFGFTYSAFIFRDTAPYQQTGLGKITQNILDSSYIKSHGSLQRLLSVSLTDLNGQARQLVWPMAIKGAMERPILGWGQENFNYAFNKFYDPKMYYQEQWFDRAHNMPLDMLVAGGFLGLLFYLGLYLACLYELWRKASILSIIEKSVITGLLAGYFFQSLFVFDNNISLFLFFTVFAIIHIYSRREKGEQGTYMQKISEWMDETGKNNEAVAYMIAPVVVIALFASLYFVNYKPIHTNHNLILAVQTQSKYPDLSLNFFKEAVSNGFLGKAEVRERLLEIAPSVYRGTVASQDLKTKFVDLAYTQIKTQVITYPNDARYQEFFGIFLVNLGDFNQALTYLLKAKELSPNKQAFRTQLVNAYLNLGQIDNVLKEAKESYDLEQNYPETKIIYGVSLIFAQDQKTFDALWGNATTSDSRISSSYMAVAKGYYDKGIISTTVDLLKRAEKINPSMTEKIEGMINSIYKGINPFK
ncbi:MAG: O-antigen ligase family protein [Minisyncoccia bacterium]